MPIEFNGNGASQSPILTNDRTTQVSRDVSTRTQQENGAPAHTDTVSLTDTATLLQSLSSRIEEIPVVDAQRVNNIRSSLDNNSYLFDFDNVSEKLISFEKQVYSP